MRKSPPTSWLIGETQYWLMLSLHSNKDENPHIIFTYKMGEIHSRVGVQCDLKIIMSDTASFIDHRWTRLAKCWVSFVALSTGAEFLVPNAKSLYVTLVRSHLKYASETWRPKSDAMIKKNWEKKGSKDVRLGLCYPNLVSFRLDYEYEIEYEYDFWISNQWSFQSPNSSRWF